MARRKKRRWSYNAGERGRNWVRGYCDGCPDKPVCHDEDHHTGNLYLEWREVVVERDPETGAEERSTKRRRALFEDLHNVDEAKRRADNAAAGFTDVEDEPADAPLTLARLFTLYRKEVTPKKGSSKRGHDRRAVRVFTPFFDAQPEEDRRMTRHPKTLDRTDCDRFVTWRREGRIPGWRRRVGDTQVGYDLKFLVAVLNWALGHTESGRPLLERNPWGEEVRRVQGWQMPKTVSPRRPAMTDAIRAKLVEHGPGGWQFEAALVIGRHTRRRNSAIRQLLWSDIDMQERTIRWRAETDRVGRANVTPMPDEVHDVLPRAPARGLGDTPVFPSEADPTRPTPRTTFQVWLRRAKARWLRSIEDPAKREKLRRALYGLGFHAEKRAGVRNPAFRRLPAKIQEEIGGTNYDTLRRVYDDVSVEEMREAWLHPRSGPMLTMPSPVPSNTKATQRRNAAAWLGVPAVGLGGLEPPPDAT